MQETEDLEREIDAAVDAEAQKGDGNRCENWGRSSRPKEHARKGNDAKNKSEGKNRTDDSEGQESFQGIAVGPNIPNGRGFIVCLPPYRAAMHAVSAGKGSCTDPIKPMVPSRIYRIFINLETIDTIGVGSNSLNQMACSGLEILSPNLEANSY